MNTSCFENLEKPKVIGLNSIDNILDMISNGNTKQLVISARKAGKPGKKYDEIKASIPTWTPNASFNEYRSKSNISNLSGFVYLDVESKVDLDIIHNLPFIYAYWTSVSGIGYGLLAKVDNLDLYNFQTVWLHLEEYFAIRNIVIDPQTKDITRQNVISFDPTLYQNPNCDPLDAKEIVSDSTMSTFKYDWDATEFNYPEMASKSDTGHQSFRTDNFDTTLTYKTVLDDYDGKDYIVIEEGKGYRDCYLPKSVEDGKRHRWLAGRTISLLFNNPDITYENLLNNAFYTNKHHMSPPKPRKDVIGK